MKSVLSKSQASELLRAASLLPLNQRDAFISAVDKQLRNVRRRLTDADAAGAIASTLTVFNTTSCFMCDAQPKEATMSRRGYELIETATGRVIPDDDPDGVLLPGQTLRVPMMFRDSMSEIQRSVADAKMTRDKRFGLADSSSLHRPGQRFSVDAAARERVEQAYWDMKRDLQDAWRQPVADATPVGRGQQPGDQCTINGYPCHLNHRLECIPARSQDSAPRGPVYDAVEGQRVKDAAYAEMVNELTTAWQRKP
jgi:hypothetical protein